jgi:hypothetical protein
VSVPGFWNQRVPELLDEIVGMYRADGRALAGLEDDELDASFVDTVDAYIADPRTPARFRAVNDVAAEYVLRRREQRRKWRDERSAEFEWLLGLSPERSERVMSLDNAGAQRVVG